MCLVKYICNCEEFKLRKEIATHCVLIWPRKTSYRRATLENRGCHTRWIMRKTWRKRVGLGSIEKDRTERHTGNSITDSSETW